MIKEKMSTMEKEKVYMGIDLGTNSCGWAVTNQNYEIIKKGGKSLHGVRLFEEANTAENRRIKRSNRRRLQRRRFRIDLLQELFTEEITEIDPNFFLRLNNSSYHYEDKYSPSLGKYSIFNEKDYSDETYYKEYPTIFHLRRKLMNVKEKPDIRLVYLAIHHILKYRGNFLMDGIDLVSGSGDVSFFQDTFNEVIFKLNQYIGEEVYNIHCKEDDVANVIDIIKKSRTITDTYNGLNQLFNPSNNKQDKYLLKLLAGNKVKFKDVLMDEDLAELDPNAIKFSEPSFDEEVAPNIYNLIGEAGEIILMMKSLYNWTILKQLLGDHQYLSESMINLYEKHHNDLVMLKQYFKKYLSKKDKYSMFRDTTLKNNYVAYIGINKTNNKHIKIPKSKYKCTYDDFLKFVKKQLEQSPETAKNSNEYQYMIEEINHKSFLPKLRTKNNSIIPYQLHLQELNKILEQTELFYPSLASKDEDNLSVSEKIKKLLTFRIPYYVGPLNNTHSPNGERFAWVVRKESGRVTPWNFEEKVDVNQSATKFIRKMTNKCTYLYGKDVLPKHSLLYSEFRVLNELNKLIINDEPISLEDKNLIMNRLFKQKKKVTVKSIKELFKTEGRVKTKNEVKITGIDQDFKNALVSYDDFKNIYGEVTDSNREKIERIIFLSTIFEDKKRLAIQIKQEFNESDEVIKKIKGLTYQGWGRLSSELLTEVYTKADENGEPINVMYLMRNENKNLQEVLFDQRFGLNQKINELNAGIITEKVVSYDNLIKDLYTSPQNKRAIWQAVKIVEEIKKIIGNKTIDSFFVEVTREKRISKRTTSRKKRIEELYEKTKVMSQDLKALLNQLNQKTDDQLRSDKLFLYFLQMGRCAYTNQPIDLDNIFTNLYDIDHIIPRSILKDNSTRNKVLVTSKANKDKSDIYPVSEDVQKKMNPFWKHLLDIELMSNEKYDRLTRKLKLTNDEIGGFINRQLVSTNQSVKALIEVLKLLNPDSTVIYSKAGNVSDFRNDFNFLKCRDVNDLHHAEDAYLNIVVGNVFHTKYGYDARTFIRENENNPEIGKHTGKIFEHNIKGAWDKTKSIKTVKKELSKYDKLVTRMPYTIKGQFYDETILPKETKDLFPMKSTSPLANPDKYGGFKKLKIAYFVVVQSKKRNKQLITIEGIPVIFAKRIQAKEYDIETVLTDYLNLDEPKVLVDNVKIDSLIKMDNSAMNISGRSGAKILIKNASQFFVSKQTKDYIRLLEKHRSELKNQSEIENYEQDSFIVIYSSAKNKPHQSISRQKNLNLYNNLVHQLEKDIYNHLTIGGFVEELSQSKNDFEALNVRQQAYALTEMIKLFQCNSSTSDLSLFMDKAKNKGNNSIGKNITDKPFRLIDQSVTGFYERTRWSNKK